VREAVDHRHGALYGGEKLQEIINGGMTELADAKTQAAALNMPSTTALNSGTNPLVGYTGAAHTSPGFSGGGSAMAASGMGPLGVCGRLGGFVCMGAQGSGMSRGGLGAALGGARGSGLLVGGKGIGLPGGDGSTRMFSARDSPARAGSVTAGSGTHSAGSAAHGGSAQAQNG